jgi:hypothetical protein
MFNYCVLSGRVITIPTLRYFGKDKPVTEFTLGECSMGHNQSRMLQQIGCGSCKALNPLNS